MGEMKTINLAVGLFIFVDKLNECRKRLVSYDLLKYCHSAESTAVSPRCINKCRLNCIRKIV